MNLANRRLSALGAPATLRYVAMGTGAAILALGMGLGLNMGWATALWP